MRPNEIICDGCQRSILAPDLFEVRCSEDGWKTYDELDFHAQSRDDCIARWLTRRRLGEL